MGGTNWQLMGHPSREQGFAGGQVNAGQSAVRCFTVVGGSADMSLLRFQVGLLASHLRRIGRLDGWARRVQADSTNGFATADDSG